MRRLHADRGAGCARGRRRFARGDRLGDRDHRARHAFARTACCPARDGARGRDRPSAARPARSPDSFSWRDRRPPLAHRRGAACDVRPSVEDSALDPAVGRDQGPVPVRRGARTSTPCGCAGGRADETAATSRALRDRRLHAGRGAGGDGADGRRSSPRSQPSPRSGCRTGAADLPACSGASCSPSRSIASWPIWRRPNSCRRTRETERPLFEGTELAVTFVRSALGPNTRPGLEIVRLAETADRRGPTLVRSRAPFAPRDLPAAHAYFADPVVLLSVPYRASFSYAGRDGVWRGQLARRQGAARRRAPDHSRCGHGSDAVGLDRDHDPRAVAGGSASPPSAERECGAAAAPEAGPQTATRRRSEPDEWSTAIRRACAKSLRRLHRRGGALDPRRARDAGLDLCDLRQQHRDGGCRSPMIPLSAEGLVAAGVELAAYRIVSVPKEARPASGQFALRIGKANVAAALPGRDRAHRSQCRAQGTAGRPVRRARCTARRRRTICRAHHRVAHDASDQDAQDREASLYRQAGLNYGPRGAPFAHVAELWLVLGLPPALVERALPHLTVYSGRARDQCSRCCRLKCIAALPGIVARTAGSRSPATRGGGRTDGATRLPAGTTMEAGDAARVTVRVDFDNGRRCRRGGGHPGARLRRGSVSGAVLATTSMRRPRRAAANGATTMSLRWIVRRNFELDRCGRGSDRCVGRLAALRPARAARRRGRTAPFPSQSRQRTRNPAPLVPPFRMGERHYAGRAAGGLAAILRGSKVELVLRSSPFLVPAARAAQARRRVSRRHCPRPDRSVDALERDRCRVRLDAASRRSQ